RWAKVIQPKWVGERFLGHKAQIPGINLRTALPGWARRWFDHGLRGIENGFKKEPPVKLFIMGDNVWRDEQEWPLARTQYKPFYLRSGGLSAQPPGDEHADQYTYNPAEPVPTRGGALMMHVTFGAGVMDQRPIEQRADVLFYTSEPLAEDTEVTGPVVVKLWACSDAPDTDFVARLVDVHPDGFAQNLTDGIIRARYRNGDTPELLQPDQSYE